MCRGLDCHTMRYKCRRVRGRVASVGVGVLNGTPCATSVDVLQVSKRQHDADP